MRRVLNAAIAATCAALLAGATAAHAGDHTWIREFKREGPPLTKRVAFVIDVSGSMRGDPIALGKREILTILSLFADDGYFKLYAFDDGVELFRAEWTPVPDREAIEAAAEWLAHYSGAGNTALADGVVAALDDPAEDLAVVLVTDGEPSGDEALHHERVKVANAKRPYPVPVHVIGVFELEPRGEPFLSDLARNNAGSFMTYTRRRMTMH